MNEISVPKAAVPNLTAYLQAGAVVSTIKNQKTGRVVALLANPAADGADLAEILADSGEHSTLPAAILALEEILEQLEMEDLELDQPEA
jgi:hypothetical protein